MCQLVCFAFCPPFFWLYDSTNNFSWHTGSWTHLLSYPSSGFKWIHGHYNKLETSREQMALWCCTTYGIIFIVCAPCMSKTSVIYVDQSEEIIWFHLGNDDCEAIFSWTWSHSYWKTCHPSLYSGLERKSLWVCFKDRTLMSLSCITLHFNQTRSKYSSSSIGNLYNHRE